MATMQAEPAHVGSKNREAVAEVRHEKWARCHVNWTAVWVGALAAFSMVLLFGLVGWGDYFDGIAARVTGQYSRLGALLDPLIDRLLVISGVVVCWHFELLPRWALALLAAREVFMLGLVRWALHHDLDIKVNWLGRLGVWPVLSALFFALAGLETVGAILLYIGLAFVLASTAKYLRDGLASRPSSTG